MIAINMLKPLKVLFVISMLIFVEYLDLVKRVTTRKIIVSTIGMKKPECVTRLYPFICEFCHETGHFNFQCLGHNSDPSNQMSTASLYCDDKITPNQHDEFTLFLGCEELSRTTSLVDMSAFDINSILRGCHLYCVKDCLANTYIQNVIKEDALPKFDRDNFCFYFINKEEESSKVSSVVSVRKSDYVEKMPFKPLPPKEESKKKKKKKKKRRSKR
jgi:hypothetical protein